MKHLFILFFTIFLFSCEKEDILPITETETPISSIEDEVIVKSEYPIKFDGGEFLEVPTDLSTPADGAELIVPVVIINYIPSSDGVTIKDWVVELPSARDYGDAIKYGMKVSTLQSYFLGSDLRQKWSLEEGSRFRGFKNENSKPYLGFKVIKYINVYEDLNLSPRGGMKIYDIFKLYEKIGMKDLVENMGVKEVWFNHLDREGVWVPESNMASPHKQITGGDVSNSYRIQDDLPIYNKTYVVYGNKGWYANNLHNHGHQFECQLADWEKYRNGYNDSKLFLRNFGGVPNTGSYNRQGRVGMVHFPPNATVDYDYTNTDYVESDILDWKPSGGTKTNVNKTNWVYPRTTPFTTPAVQGHQHWNSLQGNSVGGDPHGGWMIFWFQSIPSKNNNIPYNYNDKDYMITNWWDILYKWDETITQNKNLFQ